MANKKNKVKFGLKNCHYAIVTLAEDGTVTFGTPVAMPGAVSLSLDAEGENDPFYADDSVYYMVSNNNGYSGDFELALIPESFLTDVMHEVEDATASSLRTRMWSRSILRCSLSSPATRGRSATACTTAARPVLLFPAARRRTPPRCRRKRSPHCFASAFRSREGQDRHEYHGGCLQRLVQRGLSSRGAVNVPDTRAEDVTSEEVTLWQ
jgi:hypothetical protein